MNKVFCRKRLLFSLIFTGYLILFNTACGLDTFYVLDAPTNVVHKPEHGAIDFATSYFEFYTTDKEYESIKFLGTDVYYKIYKSSARLDSEVNDLENLASRDQSSSNAAEKLITSYRYQPLRGAGHDDVSVLIPSDGSDDKVYIRLSDYTSTYPAQITVNNDNIYGSDSRVIPVRNLSNKPSFNFSTIAADLRPKSGDVDVSDSGSSSDNYWYVSLFALAIGQDSTYSPIYSNILYLGSVRISAE